MMRYRKKIACFLSVTMLAGTVLTGCGSGGGEANERNAVQETAGICNEN